jgi:hypothetical protein
MEELNIDDVVALEPDALSAEQKTFLETNKDQLTTDEKTKFGFSVETPTPTSRSVIQHNEKSDTGAGAEGGEGTDPEDNKKIRGVVEGYMSPILKQQQEQQDRIEINAFIGANPDYAKYKGAIESHVKDPAYARIPIDRIAKMVASDDLMKIGARREREAQRKAKETGGNGNSSRNNNPNRKDWSSESKEAFEAKKNEVLGRRTT